MGKFAIILFVVVVFVGYRISKIFDPPPLPEKLKESWWGPESAKSLRTTIKPFTINVSDSVLNDLKYRLNNHRTPTPPLEGIQHQYGINTNVLKEVVDYWRTKYDWRKREKYLNKFPQFIINIQGLDIHYIHVKPNVPQNIKILPLLIVHGWPGSVREFYDVIPILTTPQEGRDFVFEVIVPHIPGYGFSSPAVRPGLSPDNVALVFKNMMHALGHDKFYVQGGDFGAIILRNLAVLYPEVVLGFHCNMCTVTTLKKYVKTFLASIYPSYSGWYVRPEHYDRVFPMKEHFYTTIRETGYLHEQSTKPDTLGVAMNDSPIGLAAYILEKFITGANITLISREDGRILEYFTYDQLLDNIMFYWITESATTSFRLYSETFNRAYSEKGILSQPIYVPTACARYSNDFYTADGMLKDIYVNLIHLTDFEGGHFAAFQLPKVFAKDVYEAIEKIEKANKNKQQ